tara:strand:+ start:1267 stop:1770 length:504 start_codon:yes stop_codon:yes gene_type:complete
MNKNNIIKFLSDNLIKNYTINEDLSVDVIGDVFINELKLNEIPIQFGKVSGSFDCSYNFLTTLKGCPISVGGDFNCHRNKIKEIDYYPNTIGGDVNLLLNKIKEFNYPFDKVNGLVYIDVNVYLLNTEDIDCDSLFYKRINNYNINSKLFKRNKNIKKILGINNNHN